MEFARSSYLLRFFRLLCEAGLGDCTAEALRAQSNEFLSHSGMVEIPRLEAKKGSVMPVKACPGLDPGPASR